MAAVIKDFVLLLMRKLTKKLMMMMMMMMMMAMMMFSIVQLLASVGETNEVTNICRSLDKADQVPIME